MVYGSARIVAVTACQGVFISQYLREDLPYLNDQVGQLSVLTNSASKARSMDFIFFPAIMAECMLLISQSIGQDEVGYSRMGCWKCHETRC